jgi:hypothetical protein
MCIIDLLGFFVELQERLTNVNDKLDATSESVKKMEIEVSSIRDDLPQPVRG